MQLALILISPCWQTSTYAIRQGTISRAGEFKLEKWKCCDPRSSMNCLSPDDTYYFREYRYRKSQGHQLIPDDSTELDAK